MATVTHDIEISEPGIEALATRDDPDVLTFRHVARCGCGWHSESSEDRAEVEKAAEKHVKAVLKK